MPNLDKVFNKFFPQSQTGSKGKFLLQMAWTVEILVAVIGVCIAIIVVMQAQGARDLDDLAGRSFKLADLTFGGIFFIVAIVELTKIPLATAVYYSVRIYWKVIFLMNKTQQILETLSPSLGPWAWAHGPRAWAGPL